MCTYCAFVTQTGGDTNRKCQTEISVRKLRRMLYFRSSSVDGTEITCFMDMPQQIIHLISFLRGHLRHDWI